MRILKKTSKLCNTKHIFDGRSENLNWNLWNSLEAYTDLKFCWLITDKNLCNLQYVVEKYQDKIM